MRNGWIKAPRHLLDWSWFRDPRMVQLLLYLMLKANTTSQSWRGLAIARGQLATSAQSISRDTDIPVAQVRRLLKRLSTDARIVCDTSHRRTHKCTLITVCGYDEYGDSRHNSAHQGDTQSAHSGSPDVPESATNIRNKEKESEKYTYTPCPQGGYVPAAGKAREAETARIAEAAYGGDATANEDMAADTTDTIDAGGAAAAARDERTLMELWNAPGNPFPRVACVSGARLRRTRARLREMARLGPPLEVAAAVISRASRSDFCRGRNGSGWRVTYDWLMANPRNWLKVYEGNYDNTPQNQTHGTTTTAYDPLDPGAERKRRMAEFICNRLHAPGSAEPDISDIL